MHELRRSGWRVGLLIMGIFSFLLLVGVVLPTKVDAQVLATLGVPTVQPTPTVDATVTILNKEKLAQEVQQLKEQNDPSFFGWLRVNASIFLSVLVVLIGGLIGLWRWFGDRRGEREKRAEERFQSAVVGLGDEKEGAQIGAAILLRTFLRSGYEQFYTQVFDLAVANLRRQEVSKIVQHRLWDPPQNLKAVLPLTILDQALIVVFKEAFPLAHDQEKREPAFLDATNIQLDNAYLVGANLKQIWGPQAFLRSANLSGADLSNANLSGTDLSNANLSSANLSGANLSDARLTCADLSGAYLISANLKHANLSGAYLKHANLNGARLDEADLSFGMLNNAFFGKKLDHNYPRSANLKYANLKHANLQRANLNGANLSSADLSGAYLGGANLRHADLRHADLSYADLNNAHFDNAHFNEAKLNRVKGLTKEQRAEYSTKGAFVDEEPVSEITQISVSTSEPLASKSGQPDSTQQTLPIPDVDQNNNISSQPSPSEETSAEAEKGD